MLASNAEPSRKMRHVGKPLGATFLGICKFFYPFHEQGVKRASMGTNSSFSSNPDPPPGLPQVFRKPTLHHPWQVPSVTRQHRFGVACDFCTDRGELSGGRGNSADCV